MGTMTAQIYSEEAGEFARLLRRALNQRDVAISDFKRRYGRSEVNGWLRDGSNGHHPSFPNKPTLENIAKDLSIETGILRSVVARSKKATARDKRINQVNSKMVS